MSRNRRTVYIITTPEKQTLFAEFRWTVSRGRDTYGYNICTLYIDGQNVSRCNGGGYDMRGTCLAEWLQDVAQDKLRRLKANYGSSSPDCKGFYGLSFYNAKTKSQQRRFSENVEAAVLTGSAGIDSMIRAGEACGYGFQYKE